MSGVGNAKRPQLLAAVAAEAVGNRELAAANEVASTPTVTVSSTEDLSRAPLPECVSCRLLSRDGCANSACSDCSKLSCAADVVPPEELSAPAVTTGRSRVSKRAKKASVGRPRGASRVPVPSDEGGDAVDTTKATAAKSRRGNAHRGKGKRQGLAAAPTTATAAAVDTGSLLPQRVKPGHCVDDALLCTCIAIALLVLRVFALPVWMDAQLLATRSPYSAWTTSAGIVLSVEMWLIP